ncbi:MAG: ABC transporter ATP-binding protein [Bacillota bacterium]
MAVIARTAGKRAGGPPAANSLPLAHPLNALPKATQPAVALRGVFKAFDGAVAVADLSLTVRPGEVVAIVGRTGAGKSTVLRLLMGTTAPERGEVRVLGRDPAREFQALRGRLAVVFQTDRLLPWRTALENAALGLEILGVPPGERLARAREWLVRLGLAGAETRLPHQLSGGMRQRVALARAFATDPEVLLLDEAFSHLDEVTAREIRADFARLVRRYGKTTLMVTHSIEEAVEMADRVAVFGRPARVIREVPVTPPFRDDPREARRLREAILAAIERGHPGEDRAEG